MNVAKWMAGAALAGGLAIGPALAQQQEGLVNVAVRDVDTNVVAIVQVPIGVAANVCGTSAAAIVDEFKGTEDTVCEITQQQAADANIRQQHGGGQGKGQGQGQQD